MGLQMHLPLCSSDDMQDYLDFLPVLVGCGRVVGSRQDVQFLVTLQLSSKNPAKGQEDFSGGVCRGGVSSLARQQRDRHSKHLGDVNNGWRLIACRALLNG